MIKTLDDIRKSIDLLRVSGNRQNNERVDRLLKAVDNLIKKEKTDGHSSDPVAHRPR
jgi:hypothetical protein